MAARGLLVLICPLAESARFFGRDVKARSFIKGLKKSNQSSKHPSSDAIESRVPDYSKGINR